MKYLNKKHQPIDDTNDLKNSELGNVKISKETITKYIPQKRKKFTGAFQLKRVSLTAKMLFLDNLATMLKASLSLAPALQTLEKETNNKYLKEIILSLKDKVENGQLLSLGMKEYPEVFPEMIVATVEVGENIGMLDETLSNLANILKSQKKLRSKVFGALMYPTIVLIALVGVSLFLSFYVFPQLISIFEGANVHLPIVLLAVQGIIGILSLYGWYILASLVGLFVIVYFIFKLAKPRLWLHFILLKIPLVGKVVRELSLTRFAGNLQALLASGLSIVKSLNIVSKTLNNLYYRQHIQEMALELEKGITLSETMSKRPKLFPSLTIQLCKVGEQTGRLDGILTKISEFYEERVNNVLANLSTIIEPILLVLVGIAVGFIAISIISPMYELTNSFAS